MSGRLSNETSPYLLQHADNPVDWYPWSREALDRAVDEDRPIFLSIGYSACHWCHVMERESFSDPATAALLNAHFVCIKVDREERPDLDTIYMDAVTALTGHGGWPLSVWLTPEGTPFYGGTYFPDRPRFGAPSFTQVLQTLSDLWRDRRGEVEQAAGRILAALSRQREGLALEADTVHEAALDTLAASFDPTYGGWGDAPKFPQPMVIEYLLMRLRHSPLPGIEAQIRRTLDAMARGGMYDRLRGGFHRYSTDGQWLVPHFEKMLYDNAQLARCYVHAWRVFEDDHYRRTAEETLEYLLAEMRHPEGGFFSSQDADSEGEEGRFFLWTPEEVTAVLGEEDGRIAIRLYGITHEGDIDGRSVLALRGEPGTGAGATTGRGAAGAGDAGDETEVTGEWLQSIRERLLAARELRERPGRDDKILASWNGLTLAAFSDAGRMPGSERYLDTANALADFLTRSLIEEPATVFRSWKDGRRSGGGFLEDYACLAEGFMALYQATADESRLALALSLADRILAGFSREGGGFYDTASDHERLVVRPMTTQDSPTPSGNALAATVLLKLGAYTGESRFTDAAAATLEAAPAVAVRAPSLFGQWLCALHLAQTGIIEVGWVGEPGAALTAALESTVTQAYLPEAVWAFKTPGSDSIVPLLAGREPPQGSAAAAWVCRAQTCSAALTSPAALAEALGVPPAAR